MINAQFMFQILIIIKCVACKDAITYIFFYSFIRACLESYAT